MRIAEIMIQNIRFMLYCVGDSDDAKSLLYLQRLYRVQLLRNILLYSTVYLSKYNYVNHGKILHE